MDEIFKDKRKIKDIVIHELWLETRIPKVIIEEIIMSQFRFIKYIAMPTYKNVWLQNLGFFLIKSTRLKYFTETENTKLKCECGWVGQMWMKQEEKDYCPYCKKEIENGIHTET